MNDGNKSILLRAFQNKDADQLIIVVSWIVVTKMQQHTLLLCVYASVTVVVRGFDPRGYDHRFPHAFESFLIDSCTAALYTIFIMSLTYWIALIQEGAPSTTKPRYLKLVERVAIAIVWGFYIACNLTFLRDKGFGGIPFLFLYLGTAVLLAAISIPFGIYGLQVLSRLQYFDVLNRQRALQTEAPVLLGDEPQRRRVKYKQQSGKVRRIIYLTEAVSMACITAQVYMAFTVTDERAELDCANGISCEDIRTSVAPLHIFQYVTIWVILWLFRKTSGRHGQTGTIVLTNSPEQV